MFSKYLLKTFFAFSLVFSLSGVANATLITQNIVSEADGVIGHVSVNIDNAEDFGGYGIVSTWTEFEFFGIDMLDQGLDNPLFEAVVDLADLSLGLISLDFDLNDVFGAYAWNGFIDVDFGGAVDVFDTSIAYFADDVSFGQVAVVPEPTAFILFFTGLLVLMVRRKMS